MKRKEVREDLDTLAKNNRCIERLKSKMKKYIYILLVFAVVVSACGTTRNAVRKNKQTEISAQDKRKHDYLFLQAMTYKAKGDMTSLFRLLKHCLEINPNSSEALAELSNYYLGVKDADKAEQYMEQAVAKAPDNFWYSSVLSVLYRGTGKDEQNVKLLQDMHKRFPDRDEVLMNLVNAYTEQGKYSDAIKTIELIEKKVGKSEEFSFNKSMLYLETKEYDKAQKGLEELLIEHPYSINGKLGLANVLFIKNKKDEAFKLLSDVLETEGDNPQVIKRAMMFYELDDREGKYVGLLIKMLMNDNVELAERTSAFQELLKAVESGKMKEEDFQSTIKKLAEKEDLTPELLVLAADYFVSKKKYSELFPIISNISAQMPSYQILYWYWIDAAVKDNNQDQVIECCNRAIKYVPEEIKFYYFLSASYAMKEQDDKAVEIITKGLNYIKEDSPKDIVSEMYEILGNILHSKGKNKEAYAAYEKSLEYMPDRISVLNNYAYYLSLDKTNLDKAEEMSYKTIKAEPQNATYIDTYAWILFIKGRYAEAKRYIEEIDKEGTIDSPIVWEHCGDIYYMAGEVDKALRCWNKALEMGSDSKTIKQKIKNKKYILE